MTETRASANSDRNASGFDLNCVCVFACQRGLIHNKSPLDLGATSKVGRD